LDDKKAAEAKAKAEEEAKLKAQKEAEKKLAKAPDKEKITKSVNDLQFSVPQLSTKEGIEKLELITDKFAQALTSSIASCAPSKPFPNSQI